MIRDIAGLLFRRRCMVCGERLFDGERDICTSCEYMMPLTGFARAADNALFRRFWGIVPVEHAAALIYFIHGSMWQRLIHGFKYRDKWRWAYVMGKRLGASLAEGGLYADVDTVVPVPLHPRRKMLRGYNQSEYIARGVAEAMGVPMETRILYRRRNNPSQPTLAENETRENVRDLFGVRNAERIRGRHLLIVDDVITSGETVTACAEALLAADVGCRISVASVAASQRKYDKMK